MNNPTDVLANFQYEVDYQTQSFVVKQGETEIKFNNWEAIILCKIIQKYLEPNK